MKISVIMSTYNRAETFLPKAVESVLNQTEKDWELIIVDDASTDTTADYCTALTDPRIRYIKLDKNSGSDTKPKNTGIKYSEGDYIAYLDDDCEYLPYHLEILAQKLDTNPDTDVVYCDAMIVDVENPERGSQPAIAKDFDSQFLMRRNFIDVSNVMHRSQAVFMVGGFDETLPKFVDWNLWVRMAKAGAKFERVPLIASRYKIHPNTKSRTVETESWYDPNLKMTMFEPTFEPAGCYIYLPYLGNDVVEELNPKVAIFTLTYDRLEYTKRMWEKLTSSTNYPFDWYVLDNGSTDGTPAWLSTQEATVLLEEKNLGLTKGSNKLIDEIMKKDYQIVIKMDNDCEVSTKKWLESFVDLWKRNHMIYASPYVEGLVHNPGGAPRMGLGFIGPYLIEVTKHVGGICAFVDARAYKDFRWNDQFVHGNQDAEASKNFVNKGYMPCYVSQHRVIHMDGTLQQHEKFPEYFERRVKEKTQVL